MMHIAARGRLLVSSVALGLVAGLVAPAAARAETTYTFAEVQKHSTRADCWSVVNGGVYNLTQFIGRHEGGPSVIIAMCGIDGTSSYNSRHGRSGGENEPARALAHYRIGVLDPASVPKPTTVYTLAQVGTHKTAADCWSAISGKVYNLTNWIDKHPGGPGVVSAMCGIDGTAMYTSKHNGDTVAAGVLPSYLVGVLDATAPTNTTVATYTLAQVAAHKTAADCWSVVADGVYNLTDWIAKHPGGPVVITAMCGVNGTAMFNSQHKGAASPAASLTAYKVGTLAGTNPTQTPKTYTTKQVSRHHTAKDCWTIVGAGVYDLTAWAAKHPRQRTSIIGSCGARSTKAFRKAHGGAAHTRAILSPYIVGQLG